MENDHVLDRVLVLLRRVSPSGFSRAKISGFYSVGYGEGPGIEYFDVHGNKEGFLVARDPDGYIWRAIEALIEWCVGWNWGHKRLREPLVDGHVPNRYEIVFNLLEPSHNFTWIYDAQIEPDNLRVQREYFSDTNDEAGWNEWSNHYKEQLAKLQQESAEVRAKAAAGEPLAPENPPPAWAMSDDVPEPTTELREVGVAAPSSAEYDEVDLLGFISRTCKIDF